MSEESKVIRKVENYTDGYGHDVIVFRSLDDENDLIIKGVVTIRVVDQGKSSEPQGVALEFPFPDGTTIKGAYEQFKRIANFEVEKYLKERKKMDTVIPEGSLSDKVNG